MSYIVLIVRAVAIQNLASGVPGNAAVILACTSSHPDTYTIIHVYIRALRSCRLLAGLGKGRGRGRRRGREREGEGGMERGEREGDSL